MRAFVKRDLDGFFGLFVDNLVQLLAIIFLCTNVCGLPAELIYGRILPGAALSVIVGNLFYAWQAHRLAKKEGRDDVTALPYGINTVSILGFVFFVMAPAYARMKVIDPEGAPEYAWRMGLLACLGSGIIEFLGAFVAERIRRVTPRAALLSTLAGIAIGYISMTFALQIFHKPLVAMLPLAIILVGLFSGIRLPLGIPSGLFAILTGTAIAWLMVLVPKMEILPAWLSFGAQDPKAVLEGWSQIGWRQPVWCWDEIVAAFREIGDWSPFLSVVIPMGLFNVIGSLQNIESAAAAGDRYSTAPSMAVNGIATIVAALFGSCFPTTIYIGHPGWKGLGARAGYSSLNGVVIVGLALGGVVNLINAVIPIDAGAAIVLWIGVIITAQAFQAVPVEHAPAVAVGLFPAIAAWGATVMLGTISISEGKTLLEIIRPAAVVAAQSPEGAPLPFPNPGGGEIPAIPAVPPDVAPAKPPEVAPAAASPLLPVDPPRSPLEVNGFKLHALLLMERGFIFTCMILSAACACLIDRKFGAAALWMLAAALFTGLGVMHAYQVYPVDGGPPAFDYLLRFSPVPKGAFTYHADDLTLAYLLSAGFFAWMGRLAKGQPQPVAHVDVPTRERPQGIKPRENPRPESKKNPREELRGGRS